MIVSAFLSSFSKWVYAFPNVRLCEPRRRALSRAVADLAEDRGIAPPRPSHAMRSEILPPRQLKLRLPRLPRKHRLWQNFATVKRLFWPRDEAPRHFGIHESAGATGGIPRADTEARLNKETQLQPKAVGAFAATTNVRVIVLMRCARLWYITSR